MTTDASTAMRISVTWNSRDNLTRYVTVNRTIDIDSDFNQKLATIGNGGRFLCFASHPRRDCTKIEIGVNEQNGLGSIARLCKIAEELALAAHVAFEHVEFELIDRMEPLMLSDLVSLVEQTQSAVGRAKMLRRHMEEVRQQRQQRSKAQLHIMRQGRAAEQGTARTA